MRAPRNAKSIDERQDYGAAAGSSTCCVTSWGITFCCSNDLELSRWKTPNAFLCSGMLPSDRCACDSRYHANLVVGPQGCRPFKVRQSLLPFALRGKHITQDH